MRCNVMAEDMVAGDVFYYQGERRTVAHVVRLQYQCHIICAGFPMLVVDRWISFLMA